ncbi:MAG: GNAT family N-acetyltransferase [Moraxellaceae bacterium]
MIIRKYGIELHRVQHSDIELIRITRNREDIRARMFDQGIISPEQQEAWFHSINNMRNYFFIIQHQGSRIGLIQGKDIDLENREAEGGIYIWEPALLGSSIPAKASICFMEATFSLLLMERVYARIRKDNHQAYRYNVALGYTPAPEKGPDYMVLTRQVYEKKIPALRKLAAGNRETLPLSINDVEIPDAKTQMPLYQDLPEDIFQSFSPRLPPRPEALRAQD